MRPPMDRCVCSMHSSFEVRRLDSSAEHGAHHLAIIPIGGCCLLLLFWFRQLLECVCVGRIIIFHVIIVLQASTTNISEVRSWNLACLFVDWNVPVIGLLFASSACVSVRTEIVLHRSPTPPPSVPKTNHSRAPTIGT